MQFRSLSGLTKIAYAPNDMPMGIYAPYERVKTKYAYSSDGRKLSVSYYDGISSNATPTDTRYYIGPIEFTKQSGTNAKLTVERVNLPWGYFDSNGWDVFNLTDYQGNIRTITSSVYNTDYIDYYPYGLPKASNPGTTSNRYKYSAKEFESRHGLDLYDYHARLQLPTAGLFSRPDPKAWDAPWNNTYLYCSANPVNRIDPDGQYDFENIKKGEEYMLIAVFQKNEIDDNKAIKVDYKAAQEAGIPIMLVENVEDFTAALKEFKDMGSSTNIYTLNSHGSPGHFKIGTDDISVMGDYTSLKDGLQGTTVFIGACNSASEFEGSSLVTNFSLDTGSTVIGSCQKIKAGYSYDGSDKLNYPSLDGTSAGNNYKISVAGSLVRSIRNVSIDKSQGIKWDGIAVGPIIDIPNLIK